MINISNIKREGRGGGGKIENFKFANAIVRKIKNHNFVIASYSKKIKNYNYITTTIPAKITISRMCVTVLF